MALIVEFICELPNGVHARPASHVETLCNTFSSTNTLFIYSSDMCYCYIVDN